jgi:(5-formylfuran-3-yl)methyl phosphate synthase
MQLLVSVRNVDEAAAALAGGADVVDVKDPSRGPLGRADAATIGAIVHHVRAHGSSGATATSAALGELREWDDAPVRGDVVRISNPHERPRMPDLFKVGLAGEAERPDWPARWAALRERVGAPERTAWVAVVYADAAAARAPDPAVVIERCVALGARVVLFDTFDKTAGGLREALGERLAPLVARARAAGCLVALAGKVTAADLPFLVSLAPDVIAVRSAVCAGGDRGNAVEAERVRSFRAALRAAGSVSATSRDR